MGIGDKFDVNNADSVDYSYIKKRKEELLVQKQDNTASKMQSELKRLNQSVQEEQSGQREISFTRFCTDDMTPEEIERLSQEWLATPSPEAYTAESQNVQLQVTSNTEETEQTQGTQNPPADNVEETEQTTQPPASDDGQSAPDEGNNDPEPTPPPAPGSPDRYKGENKPAETANWADLNGKYFEVIDEPDENGNIPTRPIHGDIKIEGEPKNGENPKKFTITDKDNGKVYTFELDETADGKVVYKCTSGPGGAYKDGNDYELRTINGVPMLVQMKSSDGYGVAVGKTLQNPPAGGAEPPAGGAEPPAGGAEPPAGGAEPPADGAEPPAGGAEPPANGDKPVEGRQPEPPADGGKPVEGTPPEPPADGGKPVEGTPPEPPEDGNKPVEGGAEKLTPEQREEKINEDTAALEVDLTPKMQIDEDLQAEADKIKKAIKEAPQIKEEIKAELEAFWTNNDKARELLSKITPENAAIVFDLYPELADKIDDVMGLDEKDVYKYIVEPLKTRMAELGFEELKFKDGSSISEETSLEGMKNWIDSAKTSILDKSAEITKAAGENRDEVNNEKAALDAAAKAKPIIDAANRTLAEAANADPKLEVQYNSDENLGDFEYVSLPDGREVRIIRNEEGEISDVWIEKDSSSGVYDIYYSKSSFAIDNNNENNVWDIQIPNDGRFDFDKILELANRIFGEKPKKQEQTE